MTYRDTLNWSRNPDVVINSDMVPRNQRVIINIVNSSQNPDFLIYRNAVIRSWNLAVVIYREMLNRSQNPDVMIY